ncbi:MAG: class I SAM-dependent methyltransferase [Candidatus Heimdallarchaeota archaeon]|nr:class I SAM-dependent methyltransferase [Candidatus Heimdallarchaeota archaeon]MCK4290156.1 class I SAM-dependent methyltransferase [Candidatus Heimdallarchaeota archaeon]
MAFNKEFLKHFIDKRNNLDWFTNYYRSTPGSFNYEIISNCIQKYLPPEDSLILDISLDPGIFSEKIAHAKRRLVIADISEEQIKTTREKFEKLGLNSQIDQFAIVDDVDNLSHFQNNSFDMTMSLFSTLSYTCEKRSKFFSEIVRVTKFGAPILFTVKNKIAFLRSLIREKKFEKLVSTTKSGIWEMLDTHYKQFEEFPGEPAYYAFTSKELSGFLEKFDCEILELFSVNSLNLKDSKIMSKLRENEVAWNNLLEIEKRISSDTGLIDSGEEILVVVRKKVI